MRTNIGPDSYANVDALKRANSGANRDANSLPPHC